MIWAIITAVATLFSTVAIVVSAIYVRAELKSLEKDRYLNITNELFSIWQSHEFMTAQLWILHKLRETSWGDFVAKHRGDEGETAFHRVGAFYDRVGTLGRMGLVNELEILTTMGGFAIAVWQKVEPLVLEARRLENSALFGDFERMLPACYQCYVPNIGDKSRVRPFSAAAPVTIMDQHELVKRMQSNAPPVVLDVRQPAHRDVDKRRIPGALVMAPDDVTDRLNEIPKGRDVVAYCA